MSAILSDLSTAIDTSWKNVQCYSGKHLTVVATKTLAAGALTLFLAPVFAAIAAFSCYSKGEIPTLADIKGRFGGIESVVQVGEEVVQVGEEVVSAFRERSRNEQIRAVIIGIAAGILGSFLNVPLALVAATGTAIYSTQESASAWEAGLIPWLQQKVQTLFHAATR